MPENPDADAGCNDFNVARFPHTQRSKAPDAVFMVGTTASPSSPDEELVYGFERPCPTSMTWASRWWPSGTTPGSLTTSPNVPCPKAWTAPIAVRQPDVLAAESPFAAVQGTFGNAAFLDMTDLLCDGITCPQRGGKHVRVSG